MPPKSLGSGGGGGEENKPILVCVSFRATTGHDRPVTHAIASMPSARVDVPVIDLRDSDEEIVPTLRNACTDVGFFYVVGHGVCVWVCVGVCEYVLHRQWFVPHQSMHTASHICVCAGMQTCITCTR